MRNTNPDESYDYTNTPAYRRKVRREQRKKAGDAEISEAFRDTGTCDYCFVLYIRFHLSNC